MNNEEKRFLWIDSTRTRYFLIPEHQDIPTGDFILFNFTGEEKKAALTAITSFEVTEVQAIAYLETELNQLIEQIETSEDVQKEIFKILEELFSSSNIEKCFPKMVNRLLGIQDKIEQSPESLIQIIHEFFTFLSQNFFIEQEKQLEEQRKQEYRKSAKKAVTQSLSSFVLPSFADSDWFSEISLLPKNEQK